MRELDQLSRKYDPLYVATKKYERAVKDLDRAFDLGRIDAKKYADEMRNLNVEMARSSGIIQDTATKTRGFGGNMSNIGFQIGDFATQVGAGTSATPSCPPSAAAATPPRSCGAAWRSCDDAGPVRSSWASNSMRLVRARLRRSAISSSGTARSPGA